jgi:DNA primase
LCFRTEKEGQVAVVIERRAQILGVAVAYFEQGLRGKARKYLQRDRGLTDETISKFRVGYAPAKRGLLDFLRTHGVKTSEAVEVGLFYKTNKRVRRFFRDRIIFPLIRGDQVLSLIGRQLPTKDRN